MTEPQATPPNTAFQVMRRGAQPPALAAPATPAPATATRTGTLPDADGGESRRFRPTLEDQSGRGALGMTVGIVGGFAVSYLYLVPLLGSGKGTPVGTVTLMTTVVMASMLVLGIAGYFLTRKKQA